MTNIHAASRDGRASAGLEAYVDSRLADLAGGGGGGGDAIRTHPFPAADADLNAIWEPGHYPLVAVMADWQAQNYPLNARGTLLVQQQTANNGSQLFIGGSNADPQLWYRQKQGDAIGPWVRLATNREHPLPAGTVDLNTLITPGTYPLVAIVADWQAQNYPANVRGHLTVTVAGLWRWQLLTTYEMTPSPSRWFVRNFNSSWSSWREIPIETPTSLAVGIGQASIRHDLLVDDMTAYHGGPIGTAGAVPVALTFDDYPRDFRDHMRAALTSRGIPYTLALSSRQYDPAAVGTGSTWEAIYNGATGTTWAEINGWLTSDNAEVANHGATHRGATTADGLHAEIVQGRADLAAALPAKPIFCWIQPSAVYDVGFNVGDSIDSYAATIAGKYIWDHHAMITGTRTINGLARAPRRGRPVQGITRSWISSSAGIAATKDLITAARAPGHGVIVGSHAKDIPDSKITAAAFAGFLDWLVTERDAGRVALMTLSQWAVADSRSALADNGDGTWTVS